MKVSELDQSLICDYCRIIEDDLTDTEKITLEAMRKAAVSYCISYTALTEEQLDEHEDITIAVLALISDMYDNRLRYVDKAHVNRTVETILNMYCYNLIPGEIEEDGN